MSSGGLRQCVRSVTPYLILIVAISALGPLQFGLHLAELNAPTDVLTCKAKSVSSFTHLREPKSPKLGLPQCIPMDEAQFALVSSIFTLGGLLGALYAGHMSGKHGRLAGMRLLTVFFIIGSILETIAGTIGVMMLGRLLSGVGAGASLVVVPIYISEVAPPADRGVFGVMTQISINTGILLTQVLGFYLSKGSSWRIILGAGAIVGGLNGVALFFLPESPAWLAANKDPQKAVNVLQRIRGKGEDISEEVSTWDIKIPNSLDGEAEGLLEQGPLSRRGSANSRTSSRPAKHVGFWEAAVDPVYRSAIIAVVAVMVGQQFVGINSVMMYSVSVLKDVFPSSAALLTIAVSLVNYLTTVLCAPLADTLGRKRSLLISVIGMGCSSIALALAMMFNESITTVLAMASFIAFFAAGMGPIPFMLASELVGQEARAAAQSWALSANWIATFVVAQFFPIINGALGGHGRVYFIFASMSVLFGSFIAWWVPETKDKATIDEVWGRTRRLE